MIVHPPTCVLAFHRLRSSSRSLLSVCREPFFSDSMDRELCSGLMSDWSFVTLERQTEVKRCEYLALARDKICNNNGLKKSASDSIQSLVTFPFFLQLDSDMSVTVRSRATAHHICYLFNWTSKEVRHIPANTTNCKYWFCFKVTHDVKWLHFKCLFAILLIKWQPDLILM